MLELCTIMKGATRFNAISGGTHLEFFFHYSNNHLCSVDKQEAPGNPLRLGSKPKNKNTETIRNGNGNKNNSPSSPNTSMPNYENKAILNIVTDYIISVTT